MTTVRFRLNGAPTTVQVPGMRRLLDVLRVDLVLTGTKEACGEGECGACSVIMDGLVVNACLVPMCQVDGRTVRTVEGLASPAPDDGRRLDPVQQALLDAGGVQCGMCIPGILMAARAWLDGHASPDEDRVREAIAGNLCRCTGYTKIVEAIAAVAAADRTAAADRVTAEAETEAQALQMAGAGTR